VLNLLLTLLRKGKYYIFYHLCNHKFQMF